MGNILIHISHPEKNPKIQEELKLTKQTPSVTLALPFCHVRLKSPKPHPNSRYPKELNTLGDHLRKRRLDLDLVQKDVNRILGVDKTTITNWENNRFSLRVRRGYGSDCQTSCPRQFATHFDGFSHDP